MTQVFGDITTLSSDVIINAANTENVHGGGVDLAITRAAGSLYKQSSNLGRAVPLGEFLVSPAGKLKAKVIIDIPTIDLVEAKKISLDQLEQVWRSVLVYCQEHKYKTIATPLLGAGVVGYTQSQITKLLKKVAHDYADLEVRLVIFR